MYIYTWSEDRKKIARSIIVARACPTRLIAAFSLEVRHKRRAESSRYSSTQVFETSCLTCWCWSWGSLIRYRNDNDNERLFDGLISTNTFIVPGSSVWAISSEEHDCHHPRCSSRFLFCIANFRNWTLCFEHISVVGGNRRFQGKLVIILMLKSSRIPLAASGLSARLNDKATSSFPSNDSFKQQCLECSGKQAA